MNLNRFYFFVLTFLIGTLVFTDAHSQGGSGWVRGNVIDSASATPLAYATVRVFKDGKLANGTLTDESGSFAVQLPFGQYTGEIEFVGYSARPIKAFNLSADDKEVNLGSLHLSTSVKTLSEVTVEAEKSTMELTLDKRIFNVGKDLANAGGSATDILMNIPSVSVDPEGNVKLRGSDNVRILIDGKPSGLVSFKGGSGLQQLQANMVERVEVITNPSARYEAEGNAGIINIVLKKATNEGFNGSFDVITGQPANFGVAANFNYRHKKVNFFLNYGVAYRVTPGRGKLYQELYNPGQETALLKQSSGNAITGFHNNIRGGIDYFFNEKTILTGSYLFRRTDVNRITDIRYEDYISSLSSMKSYTLRRQNEDEIEPNSEYSLIYRKTFEKKEHSLVGEVKFIDNWENSNQLFTQNYFIPDGTRDPDLSKIQTSVNDEFEKQLLFQVDYTKPFAKEGKFETGLRSSFRKMINDYVVSDKDDSGTETPIAWLDNIFEYNENIHAVYGIVGNKHNRFSYQAGLRAEWTDVKTTLRETNEVNPRKYSNLFPSAHVTMDLPKDNALQLSYSRRVRRPVYNDLSPFMTFSDSRNFSSGNPNLNPEFSDVLEVGHLKYFEKGSLSTSTYFRNTLHKIDRIRTVNDEGNSVNITENLKHEKALGIDMAGEFNPYKWWRLDLNFNFFHADIDGTNIIETYKASTYSWFVRQTSRFMLPYTLDIQLRGNYEAAQKTAQGKRRALYYADFSMSKDILKGRGTMNFNVLDIFNSRRVRSDINGLNFHTESSFQGRRRQINLTFSYRIKQSKGGKKQSVIDEG